MQGDVVGSIVHKSCLANNDFKVYILLNELRSHRATCSMEMRIGKYGNQHIPTDPNTSRELGSASNSTFSFPCRLSISFTGILLKELGNRLVRLHRGVFVACNKRRTRCTNKITHSYSGAPVMIWVVTAKPDRRIRGNLPLTGSADWRHQWELESISTI